MDVRVLLIDDDARLHELLSSYMQQNGVALDCAGDGATGLARLHAGGYDAVLLDGMMPGMDGIDVLRQIRSPAAGVGDRVPVIMLTARGDEADRIVGLELGADDYVPKPFNPRELLARIRAVLRRAHPQAESERLSAGGIVADLTTREASVDGRALDLTGLEFDLLAGLLRRAGRVVPRDALLALAGRTELVGERTVDVHISKLRRKLGDDPRSPRRIKTVRGVGYTLSREAP